MRPTLHYTPRQLFELLGGAVPLSSLYQHLKSGQIRGVKPFGRWLIPADEVKRILAGGKETPRAQRPGRPPRATRGGLTFRHF